MDAEIDEWTFQERDFISATNPISAYFAPFVLELHPQKTRIVYCKDANRQGNYLELQFDFLGYTFRPRGAMNRAGKMFVSFIPQ